MLEPTILLTAQARRTPTDELSAQGLFEPLIPLAAQLSPRLRSGMHLILHGPRGAGKSTLLTLLLQQYRQQGVPCAIAPRTGSLADVVDALVGAYPHVEPGRTRRALAARVRLAAEQQPGVLLLDHVRELTGAALGFLKLLRGGVAGVLFAVDIDVSFERERVLSWRRHALCMRMPLMPALSLRALLQRSLRAQVPPLPREAIDQIVAAARGRIGWLTLCLRRLREPNYWRNDRLQVTVLCTDCELALRDTPGPRLRRRAGPVA